MPTAVRSISPSVAEKSPRLKTKLPPPNLIRAIVGPTHDPDEPILLAVLHPAADRDFAGLWRHTS